MRPMRLTSQQAWDEVTGSDFISDNQKTVYCHVSKNGPCTAKEVQRIFELGRESRGAKGIAPALWKRFSELKRFGVIMECGTKKCSISGRNSTAWMCTDRGPEKPEEDKSGSKMPVGAGNKALWLRIRVLEAFIRGLGYPVPK